MSSDFLTTENCEQETACSIEEFPLPHKPSMRARVKQLPIGELKRLAKAIQSPVQFDRDKAEIEMIQKSIVNADGTIVFSDEKIASLKTGNAPLYASLVTIIGKANNKSQEQVDAQLDAAEKN